MIAQYLRALASSGDLALVPSLEVSVTPVPGDLTPDLHVPHTHIVYKQDSHVVNLKYRQFQLVF